MKKASAILVVNNCVGHRLLNQRNTSFANVNSSKAVWWLNVGLSKFRYVHHLLLADESKDRLTWLRIDEDDFPTLDKVFRIRQDKLAVDLEISCLPSTYMIDVKSGGTRYNFSRHIQQEF